VATPEDIVFEQRKQLIFEREWLMLSEIERVALELRSHGRKFAEIGEIVGLDRRRVAEIVASAIQRLAEKIGE
jgi:DNA-directed RNA polymerase specialized sigma subunit